MPYMYVLFHLGKLCNGLMCQVGDFYLQELQYFHSLIKFLYCGFVEPDTVEVGSSKNCGCSGDITVTRVSFETSFDSKQPKLEPKLVLALSETKHLFCCFASIPKQRVLMFQLNRNKQKTNRNSLMGSIFCNFFRKLRVFQIFLVFSVLFRFSLVCLETVCFSCFASIRKQIVSMF